MREIKFRAFFDGKIYPVTNLDYIQDGSGIVAHIHVKGINQEIPSGQFELMQYTGLKDKNGVEIYEGDILKTYGECTWNETVTPAEGTVVWSNEPDDGTGFLIKTKWGLVDFDCLDIRVVGNIFEGVDK